MKLKFIDIGSKNANFIKECKNELTYEWLLKALRPYLYSHNIDFEEGTDNRIYVFAGIVVRVVEELLAEDFMGTSLLVT